MIYRNKHKDKYSVIANDLIQSTNIGFFEKGILMYLLSKPHTWETKTKDLMAVGSCGRDKILTALNRLEEAGYLQRYRTRDDKGQYTWNTDISETPFPENPDTDNPEQDNPEQDNPTPENTDIYKVQNNKVQIDKVKNDKVQNEDNALSTPKVLSKVGQAREVFEDWKEVMESPKSKMDSKREKLIIAKLDLGYSIEDLKLATRGCVLTPWNMGTDPNNKAKTIYNDPELIFRDAAHVDRFRAVALKKGKSANDKLRKSDYDGTKSSANRTGFVAGKRI